MVWNVMILDDNGRGFKKVVILSLKKRVLLLPPLFDLEVIFGVFDAKI
jgi:hypothetical protein